MIRFVSSAVLYIALGLGANVAAAQDLGALVVGEMADLVVHDAPVAASALPYLTQDEAEAYLSDYQGRYVLLNFWATWCAPCRHEMPALDALQRQFGGTDFVVVTLATGRNSPQAMRRFFEEEAITDLTLYRDINQQIAREMDVTALPITVILNPEGQEIARMLGEADWVSPEAVALIGALIGTGG
jgi:thiol-disulfide isomerase/thioredoxin